MNTPEHDCFEDECVFCTLTSAIEEKIDSSTQIVLTTLNWTPDELRSRLKTLDWKEIHGQLMLMLHIDDDIGLPPEKPLDMQQFLWDVLKHAEEPGEPHGMQLARLQLLIFLLEMEDALIDIEKGYFELAVGGFGEACSSFGQALSYISAAHGKGSIHSQARLGARRKLERDPKQFAKQQVRECWDIWKAEPSRYKSKSAFAKDMLSKYEQLESSEVIQRWCREWDAELSQ